MGTFTHNGKTVLACSCWRTCGDIKEVHDDPNAVCKGLPGQWADLQIFKMSDTPRSGPDVNSGHAHSGPAHNRKDRST